MPSKREAILGHLLTALDAINGVSPYLTTPKTKGREYKPVEEQPATAFPVLYVTGGDETRERQDNAQMYALLKAEIRGFVRRAAGPATGGTVLSTTLNNLLSDVERAVYVDETRAGNALLTRLISVEVDEISLDEIAGFLAIFEIPYIYLVGQP
jgi:hypothetical protein